MKALIFFVLICIVFFSCKSNAINSNQKTAHQQDTSYVVFFGDYKKNDLIHYYTLKNIFDMYGVNETMERDSLYFIKENVDGFQEFTFNYADLAIPYFFFNEDSIQIEIEFKNAYRLKSRDKKRQTELDLQYDIFSSGKNDIRFAYQNRESIESNWKHNILQLDNLMDSNMISNKFYNIYKIYLTSCYVNQIVAPLLFNEIPNYEIDFSDLLGLLPKDIMYSERMYSYTRALMNMISAQSIHEFGSKDIENLIKVTTSNFQGELKDFLIAYEIKIKIYYSMFHYQNKEDILAVLSTDKYKEVISNFYQNSIDLKSMKDDTLMSLDNKETSFNVIVQKSFVKPIYIDFWASWCVPCKEEFKYYPDLFSEMQNKYYFYFLSIDTDTNKWINGSKEVHFLNNNNSYLLKDAKKSALFQNLKLNSIPRYIIIKNGIIINDNAFRPSNPGVLDFLNRYLL